MPATSPDPVFHAPPVGTLLDTPLDLLDAVYDRRSGLTHLVAQPVPAILDALASGPATATQLMTRLADEYALEGESSALAARLTELLALGLVEAEGG